MKPVDQSFFRRLVSPKTKPGTERSAPLPPNEAAEQPSLDLVTLRGGTPEKSLKEGLVKAGRTLLFAGLPVAGAVVAGPVGAALGTLASGVVSYAENSHLSQPARLRKAAKAALSVAVFGLAPAAIGGGIAWAVGASTKAGAALAGSLPTVLLAGRSGKAGYDNARFKGKTQFKGQAFARHFESRVQEQLKDQGVDFKPAKKLGLLKRLSPKAREDHASAMLARTAVVACHHLGPAATLAIANALGKQSLPQGKGSQLDKGMLAARFEPESTQTVEGVPIHRVKDLAKREFSPGVAQTSSVYIDSAHEPGKEAVADFIVGHELSHVKNQDVIGALAEGKVVNSVQETRLRTGDVEEYNVLMDAEQKLEDRFYQNSRETEHRCDDEGFRYALSQGHSAEEIVSAAAELFGDSDREDVHSAHPAASKRVKRLQELSERKPE